MWACIVMLGGLKIYLPGRRSVAHTCMLMTGIGGFCWGLTLGHSVPTPQGYTKLLDALGSNPVEFLSNLNNLHLHLTSTFPEMCAPAFRCDKVCTCGGVHVRIGVCSTFFCASCFWHMHCSVATRRKLLPMRPGDLRSSSCPLPCNILKFCAIIVINSY